MISLASLAMMLATGAVGLEVEASDGLDPGERLGLLQELGQAVSAATGQPPARDRNVRLVVRARRVSWRIQLSIERREGGDRRAREEAVLTRDPRSWRGPVTDMVARLLPDGRALAAAAPAPMPSMTTPPITATPPPPPISAPPAAATRAAREAPRASAAPPAAPDVRAQPDPVMMAVPIAAEAPSRSKIIPLLALGAGVACAVGGVTFVLNASEAIDNANFSIDPDEIEEQQRAVFENAVIGSVLLSAGSAALVTGLVLLLSD